MKNTATNQLIWENVVNHPASFTYQAMFSITVNGEQVEVRTLVHIDPIYHSVQSWSRAEVRKGKGWKTVASLPRTELRGVDIVQRAFSFVGAQHDAAALLAKATVALN